MRERFMVVLSITLCALLLGAAPVDARKFDPDDPRGPTPPPGQVPDVPDGFFDVTQPAVYHPTGSDDVERGRGLVASWTADPDNDAEGLERRARDGTWVTVRGLSRAAGTIRLIDFNLQPDTRYCYRRLARRDSVTRASGIVCERTQGAEKQPIVRLQVEIEVGSADDAGTKDAVMASAGIGKLAWLDRPGRDFERLSVQNYDLPPGGDMSNIESLRVQNTGDDDLCVAAVRLLVNNSQVFERWFGYDTCMWIGRDSAETQILVRGDELRDDSSWVYPDIVDQLELVAQYDGQPVVGFVLHLPADELRGRLESAVGHAIHGTGIYWANSGSAGIENKNASTISLDFDLGYDVNNWFDPSVDVTADLELGASTNDDGDTTVTMRTKNTRIDIDADPVFDVLSEVLMCRLIWGAVEHDDFKSCVDQITELVSGKYLDAVSIGRAIAVNAAEINGAVICCQDAFVNVNEDTSVDVVFVLGEPEPQPEEPEPPRAPPRPPRDLGLDPKGNDLPIPRLTPFYNPGYPKPARLKASPFFLP